LFHLLSKRKLHTLDLKIFYRNKMYKKINETFSLSFSSLISDAYLHSAMYER